MRKKPTTIEEQREARRLRLERKKKKTLLKSKWIWIAVTVFLILLGVNYLYHIEVFPIYPPAQTVYYTPATHISGTYLKDNYYLTTIDGVKTVNIKGEDVAPEVNATISPFIKAMKEPVYEKSQNTVLVYDIAGTSALLFDESGIIAPFTFNGDIVRARMNQNGQFVMIVNEDGSKAAVKVYDQYGNEKYTWYSGTGYVVDATINPDNNVMAVLTNDVSNGSVTAKVLFFRMDTPEPVRGHVVGNRVGASVSYRGNQSLVLCANGLYLVTDSGDLSLITDVSGRDLKFFDYFTDGSILLCFTGNSVDTYSCEVYDAKGRRTAQFSLDAFVRIGDIEDDKFVVFKRKEFFNVTKQGKIMKSGVTDYDIQHATYFQNRVALIGQERMSLQ